MGVIEMTVNDLLGESEWSVEPGRQLLSITTRQKG
jgi:hypothetical protein